MTFGGTVTVQGTLSGTGNAKRAVVLQANPFPFTAALSDRRQPRADDGHGRLQLHAARRCHQSTQFQVVTTTKPVVASLVATENVAVRVSSHVARTKRHGFARIYGTVTPAEDGAQVGILRIAHGHGVLAGGTMLRHHERDELELQPRRARAQGHLPRARARRERGPGAPPTARRC